MDDDLLIARRDYDKIISSCNRTGYVEGTEVGKNQGLKEGFVDGFIRGMEACTHSAVLTGRMSAMKVLLEGKLLKTATEATSQDIQLQIKKIRTLLSDFEDETCKEAEQILQESQAEYTRKVQLPDGENHKDDRSSSGDRTPVLNTVNSHKPFIELVNTFPTNHSVDKFSISRSHMRTSK